MVIDSTVPIGMEEMVVMGMVDPVVATIATIPPIAKD